MSQYLLKNIGGTLETYGFFDRTVSSCTVTLYTGQGSKKVDAGPCTIDSVSTTLSADSVVGDTAITATSLAGLVVGRRYAIGTVASTEPREVVEVKAIVSPNVELWSPLLYDHSVGVTLKGCRVSATIASTACDGLWWDGFADFVPDSGDTVTESVSCVLRKIQFVLDETDLLDVFPDGAKILGEAENLPRLIRQACERAILDLGGKNRAHTLLGSDHFRPFFALKFWLLRRFEIGEDWKSTMDSVEQEYTNLKRQLIDQVPVDADQDGTTTGASDGGINSIILERS